MNEWEEVQPPCIQGWLEAVHREFLNQAACELSRWKGRRVGGPRPGQEEQGLESPEYKKLSLSARESRWGRLLGQIQG